jgi:hypothetical protein
MSMLPLIRESPAGGLGSIGANAHVCLPALGR